MIGRINDHCISILAGSFQLIHQKANIAVNILHLLEQNKMFSDPTDSNNHYYTLHNDHSACPKPDTRVQEHIRHPITTMLNKNNIFSRSVMPAPSLYQFLIDQLEPPAFPQIRQPTPHRWGCNLSSGRH